MRTDTSSTISWYQVNDQPDHKRVMAWADTINDTYYPLDLKSLTGDFRTGRVGIFDVSRIRVAQVHSDPMLCVRRRTHTARSGGDFYFLPIPYDRPLAVAQRHGTPAELAPGDFSVISTYQPYSYEQPTENRLISLRIDGAYLRERIPAIDDLLGQHWSSERPAVRLFTDMARSFARNAPELDAASAARLAGTLTDLLALSLEAPEGAYLSAESPVRAAHRSRIFNAVERHLADPALSPAQISRELGLSMRYIQKLLAERDESLSGLIRRRRIAAARADLADPGRANLSVGAIGFGVGYVDAAYFSRVFRAETGMTPSEYRRQSLN
ncbi:MAG: helix-turn-helix domain-containing protein [Minwuia sp.]|uniref:helix-turn-helix domain-containing protein n=1 Tax=Minwuia sp. TaxID=2493630 RepID=UPI003A83CEED